MGDNAASVTFPTVETDVDTLIEFQITGYDLDDPNFGISLNGSPVYKQWPITQVSFNHTAIGEGRSTVVTYQLDPSVIPDSIADPLSEGEAMVIPLTVNFGSIQQGFQSMNVEGQFVEETVQVRAIDQYGAASDPVTITLSIEGANDAIPNYQNPDGSPNYSLIGFDPSTSPELGILSGLENNARNLDYISWTEGDDVLQINADAFG